MDHRRLELHELREEFFEERARIVYDERHAALGGDAGALHRAGVTCVPEQAAPPVLACERATRDRQSRLRAIERALELLASGEYGSCTLCGGSISSARLHAAPDQEICCRCARSAR